MSNVAIEAAPAETARAVQRVRCTKRDTAHAQQEAFGLAVHGAGELEVPVQSLVQGGDDGAVDPGGFRAGEPAFSCATGHGGDDLRHGQVGGKQVVAALDRAVELIATGLGQVELEQGARITVNGAGQPARVSRRSLAQGAGTAPGPHHFSAPCRRWAAPD